MSYCRWSSDDFWCDVYCYEDCHGGWTTHVAGSRYVFKKPLPPPVSYKSNPQAFFHRMNLVSEMVGDADVVSIGLPYDGESFNDGTADATADRLEMLRGVGYNVPQYAIDALRSEAEETAQGAD